MTSPLLNRVTPKDTIETWRQKTNEIVDRLKDLYPHVDNNLYVENDAFIKGHLTVDGDLEIKGDTTTVNTTELNIEDNIILLNSNLTATPPNLLESGIEVNRGSSDNKRIYWDEADDKWNIEGDLNVTGYINNMQWVFDPNTNHISNLNSGKVGIGTTNPDGKLHVKSSGTGAENVASFGNGNINSGLYIRTDDGDLEWGLATLNQRDLIFETNQTRRMTIDGATGKVDIGAGLDVGTVDTSHALLGPNESGLGINFRVQGKVYARDGIHIMDRRNSTLDAAAGPGDITPTDWPSKSISTFFTNQISGSSVTWDSGITVRGWSDGRDSNGDLISTYRVWQLFSNSSDSMNATVENATNNDLYFRSGTGETWETSQKIWTSANLDPNAIGGKWLDGLNTGDIHYSSGNVGIGKNNPSAKLHISTNNSVPTLSAGYNANAAGNVSVAMGSYSISSGFASFSMGGYVNATGNYAVALGKYITVSGDNSFGIGLDNNNRTLSQANTMAIMGGNVGIGTTSPIYRLDVTGGRAIVRGTPETALVLDDSGVADLATPMQYISSDGGFLKLGNANRGNNSATTNSVDRMVISSGGDVGIGVNIPLTKLHVDGTIRASNLTGDRVLVSNSSKDIISSSITTTELGYLSGVTSGIQTQIDNAGKWDDQASSGDVYRNSNVGIGNFSSTALTEKLELRSTSGDSFIKITDTDNNSNNEIGMIFEKTHTNLYDYKISNYSDTFYFNYRQNVGDAWTVFYGYIPSASTSAFVGNISATGTIQSTSDITLKENLEIIENPIEKIKEINGYTYNMIGKDERDAGLVAQEVEKVLPEVVSENSDGIKSLAYGNIMALLVETVKEQQKQIDELKKLISDK